MKRVRHLQVVPDAADETDGTGVAYWAGLPEMEPPGEEIPPPEEPPEEEEIDAEYGDADETGRQ